MAGAGVICGLKLTHDGAVAVLDGDRLVFSVEAEKIDNRRRHAALPELADVVDQLDRHGVDVGDLDAVSVDGWVQSTDGLAGARIVDEQGERMVDLAGYAVIGTPEEPLPALGAFAGSGFPLGGKTFEYHSYPHATGHAFASYSTSPHALRRAPALVLVWDGGMPATLYRIDPGAGTLMSLGVVVPMVGALYPVFAAQFDPFRVPAERRRELGGLGDFAQLEALLPVSGKAMAYAALDHPDERAIAAMVEVSAAMGPVGITGAFVWSHRVIAKVAGLGLSDAALIASFQEYLFRVLREGLANGPGARYFADGEPLCLSGGCALNIKWNSGLRASGHFSDVWVPPFPNDAGSAIGTACAERFRRTGEVGLEWSVFSGPDVVASSAAPGWSGRPCDLAELARLLHTDGEPVVVVSGRAELGPRALGHRSIIAPATTAAMRDRLNDIKGREHYRPVAPICLVDRAAEVFAPGTPDPHMLFEHHIRPGWADRVPAIVHTDGSARLQTVGPDHPVAYELLTEYARLSGVPVLCNTSANHPGRGFFPDAGSAMRWGGVTRVWSEGVLYTSGG
ncbi:carbamoyltransferase N-terminal domain-containing protein [Actinokineospora enzanensis]|uniref:carbamoyltransferase N-terminal domain-containing protein n=1 Tax=Actinokineospora enzanensis TaxID=155975 RepID=UPI0003769B56|nr:carbamoyltransferase N-terminal domain-containing protein [Actinokineospora enzanensis]